MRQIKFCVMLVCVFGFSSTLFAQDSPDEAAINALIGKVTEAWNNDDTDSLALLVDESVIYVDSSGNQIQGKEAYCERHKEVLQNPALKESRSSSTLRNLSIFPASENAGSLAVADVQWQLTNIRSTDTQKTLGRQGHSDLVLKQANGAWKIVAHRTYRLETPAAIASIKEAFVRREQAWNKQDLEGLLIGIADDISYESSAGERIAGKKDLKEKYLTLFAGPLKNSKTRYTIEQVQFIQDDIALVDTTWTLETNDGNARTGSSTILMRNFLEKDWKIVSLRPRVDNAAAAKE